MVVNSRFYKIGKIAVRSMPSGLCKLLAISMLMVVTGCEYDVSSIDNDTGRQMVVEHPAVGKCHEVNDILEDGQGVSENCRISSLTQIRVIDTSGKEEKVCNIDIADFRKKIKIIHDKNGGKDVIERIYLSQLNCPNLGLPMPGIPEVVN